jgi:hypothetical protein
MTRRIKIVGGILPALLVAAGCSKDAGSGTVAGTAASVTAAGVAASTTAGTAGVKTATASAPVLASAAAAGTAAPPGAPTPSADPTSTNKDAAPVPAAGSSVGATPGGAVSVPASANAAAATASSPVAAAIDPEAARKSAKIEWALKQEEIKSDPDGQWAVDAKASSTRGNAQGTAAYAPSQATGLPNIESVGNSPLAWTPATPDAGIEWLDLQYAKPVHATLVRVRESYGSGAIIKVELFDEQGAAHTVWTGVDSTKDLDYLLVPFAKTAFKTARIRLTLATNVVPGMNEIDAVQLVGSDK